MLHSQMEKKVLQDLKGENNLAFGLLYKEFFPVVNRFIISNKGSTEDAEDIFQDSMIILLEKLSQDHFILTASIKTYIMAIAKNLWLKRLRNRNKEVELTDYHSDALIAEINTAIEQERSYWDKLQHYMHKITEHCKGLIHDIFFKEKAVEEIQKQYGYSSKHNAQNQKHKCVEQIRKVKENEEKNMK
jgi:RNA polymerase sigma factor (sigma-70 family)